MSAIPPRHAIASAPQQVDHRRRREQAGPLRKTERGKGGEECELDPEPAGTIDPRGGELAHAATPAKRALRAPTLMPSSPATENATAPPAATRGPTR